MRSIDRVIEIALNPMVFLENVLIKEPGELRVKYEVWAHLRVFWDFIGRYKLGIILKSKQVGISWALAVEALRRIYTIPGYNVLALSSGQVEAQRLLEKAKVVYQNLPEWMQVYTLEPNSGEQFGFKEMGSVIRALPSTEKAGIGETAGLVIHDEGEFHDFFEVNIGHTLATVADAPERQLLVVSTVDKTKPDSLFKRLYRGARGSGYPEAGSNSFQALFLPYNVRPNRDDMFLEEQRRTNESTPWVVEANYPQTIEEALSPVSVQSCFKKERLDQLWAEVVNPELRKGYIYILCPPRVGIPYAGGVDVGEGVGLDYSVLSIIGKGLVSEVAAVIYTNELATDLFAYECAQLCSEYFNALLAVENNSLGIAVTNKLQELGYSNLFHSESGKIGWTTGEKNKQLANIELIDAVNNGSLISRFKPMLKEFYELQWVQGKAIPTGKTHGDLVMSVAIANQMLKKVGTAVPASMYVRGRKIF